MPAAKERVIEPLSPEEIEQYKNMQITSYEMANRRGCHVTWVRKELRKLNSKEIAAASRQRKINNGTDNINRPKIKCAAGLVLMGVNRSEVIRRSGVSSRTITRLRTELTELAETSYEYFLDRKKIVKRAKPIIGERKGKTRVIEAAKMVIQFEKVSVIQLVTKATTREIAALRRELAELAGVDYKELQRKGR